MTIRTMLPLVAAVLALGGNPGAVAAQSSAASGILLRSQIDLARVTSAYDAVARARPAWLEMAAGGRVLVRVDGTASGELDALHQVLATEVEAIEFVPREALSGRLPDVELTGVSAAFIVTSREEERAAGSGLRLLQVTAVIRGALENGPSDWSRSLEKEGYSALGGGTTNTPTAVIGVRYAPPIGIGTLELLASSHVAQNEEPFKRGTSSEMHLRYNSIDVAMLLGQEFGRYHLGLGPLVSFSRYVARFGECGCTGHENGALLQKGAALSGGAVVPLRGSIVADLRAQVQYASTESMALWENGPEITLGGTRVMIGAGLGFRPRTAGGAP